MISKSRLIALTTAALIVVSSVSAFAAAPKKRKPQVTGTPTTTLINTPQASSDLAGNSVARGCGLARPAGADESIWNALQAKDAPQMYSWSIPRDKLIPKGSLVSVHLSFEGDEVRYMEMLNDDDITPSKQDVVKRGSVSYYKCLVEPNGEIVLSDDNSKEVHRFMPRYDEENDKVTALFSKADERKLVPDGQPGN